VSNGAFARTGKNLSGDDVMRRMKQALTLLLVLAAGCATGSKDGAAQPPPELEFVQLVGTNEVQSAGPFDVKYGVRVRNPSTQPITLRRIELRQIGTGTYQLVRNSPVLLQETIGPGGSVEVSFWQHAYARVLPGNFGSSEPVTLRVVAFFESPHGSFQRIKQVVLGQFD
jgi:hypothetical protein